MARQAVSVHEESATMSRTAGGSRTAGRETEPLSVALRLGSRAEHEAAESSPFVTELLAGKLAATAYADLLVRLRHIYGALEKAVRRNAADPFVAAVYDPGLERLASIDADLTVWAPDEGVGELASPAVTAYVDRINDLADWGAGLAAHHYTRYLGDLSGGQAIGRILERTYPGVGGPDRSGIRFYEFTSVPKPKLYKDAYRSRLDALDADPAEIARMVEEVKLAFGFNRAVFVELGARLPSYRMD